MVKRKYLILFLFLWLISSGESQEIEQVIYKEIDTTVLRLEIYRSEHMKATERYPAMIFFFGGGWNGGTIDQFKPHASYFSSRGIICFLADYRVKSRQQTSPFESLKDAKSAIRFIRENADQYHVDTNKIIAAGGSAGGHLAAATALIPHFNEDTDNQAISCIPNALVLFNPVIDNGPGGYGFERIGDHYKEFSPLHNIVSGAPPTIFFLGTEDKLIPVETAKYYQKVMEKVGSLCELHLYEGEGHGFFNYKNAKIYKETVYQTDQFLTKLGYLSGEPTIK